MEDIESQGIELFHATIRFAILGGFLDEVKHVVDRLFGIIACDGRLDVSKELFVVLYSLDCYQQERTNDLRTTCLVITRQLELQLDSLL